jgi:hypothetical protein
LRGERANLRVHRVVRALRSGDQIDLVALDDPAGDVAGVVGSQLCGWERLDSAQQIRVDAHRCAYQIIVESLLKAARRGLPAHVLHLPRLDAAVALERLGRVMVVACFGRPFDVDAGVESPIGQIDSAHRVRERLFLAAPDGASHSLPYHARMRSRATGSLILNGKHAFGANAAFVSS